MTDLDAKYMTRQELYRESCTPREGLDPHFVDSLTFRIIQDDPEQWDEELDKQVCQPWCAALRAAIGEAWENYRTAEFTIERDVNPMFSSEAFGRRYTAMKVIRNIAREMYRHTVPHEERIL